MCCLALVLGFLGPRFAFLFVWITDTSKVTAALGSGFWAPLIGLIFLPWTALAYVLCWSPVGGVSGFGWFIVVLGFFFDISTWSGRFAQQRYQSGQATA